MRLAVLFTIIFMVQLAISEETDQEPIEPVVQNDSIIFTYEILEPKADVSDISVSGDTVNIKLFYVDVFCGKYEYKFETNKKSLKVRRVHANSDECQKDTDMLYSVKGKIINVPSGKFLFELESEYDNTIKTIFRDVVVVK